jgi:Rod binding domain-containing protein
MDVPATLTPEQFKALFINNFVNPMREALTKPEPLTCASLDEIQQQAMIDAALEENHPSVAMETESNCH